MGRPCRRQEKLPKPLSESSRKPSNMQHPRAQNRLFKKGTATGQQEPPEIDSVTVELTVNRRVGRSLEKQSKMMNGRERIKEIKNIGGLSI